VVHRWHSDRVETDVVEVLSARPAILASSSEGPAAGSSRGPGRMPFRHGLLAVSLDAVRVAGRAPRHPPAEFRMRADSGSDRRASIANS
jgi:hypothetical protein